MPLPTVSVFRIGYESGKTVDNNLWFCDSPNATLVYFDSAGRHSSGYTGLECTAYINGTSFDVNSPTPQNQQFTEPLKWDIS